MQAIMQSVGSHSGSNFERGAQFGYFEGFQTDEIVLNRCKSEV